MSVNGSSQVQAKALVEVLSKRQQMKLDQTLKLFQSQEIQQVRHPKRRAHTHNGGNEQLPRKQIKIDAPCPLPQSEDIISSSSNSHEPVSTTPLLEQQHPSQLPHHLNPSYALPEGQPNLFNYLLCYAYSQGERQFEKETHDWTLIDQIAGESLLVIDSNSSAKICKRLDTKFNEQKDRIREPFGRSHREFGQKFMKKEYLLQ